MQGKAVADMAVDGGGKDSHTHGAIANFRRYGLCVVVGTALQCRKIENWGSLY